MSSPVPASKASALGRASSGAKPAPDEAIEVAALRIDARETALRDKVRGAGGYWDPGRAAWMLRLDRVRVLGLRSRLISQDRPARGSGVHP